MLKEFDKDSLEYAIIDNRYKYIRVAQGLELDSQKGLIIPDFPKWWTKIEKDMSSLEKSVTVTKRPYFFRYLYDYMGKRYNEERLSYENIARTIYNQSLDEIIALGRNRTRDQYLLIEQYKRDSSFIDNESVMNKVSHHMEEFIKHSSSEKRIMSKDFNYRILLSNPKYKSSKNDLDKMQLLFKEYKSLKRALREGVTDYMDNNFTTLEQILAYINKKGYSTITSNSEEMGNMAVTLCYGNLGETSRKFVWECFGNEVFENIAKRKKEKFVRIPMKSEKGSFEYLFAKYGMYPMNISEQ